MRCYENCGYSYWRASWFLFSLAMCFHRAHIREQAASVLRTSFRIHQSLANWPQFLMSLLQRKYVSRVVHESESGGVYQKQYKLWAVWVILCCSNTWLHGGHVQVNLPPAPSSWTCCVNSLLCFMVSDHVHIALHHVQQGLGLGTFGATSNYYS